MSGKLIVFEGTDGSGKSTQFARLCRRMEAEERPFQKLIFPQYGEPSSALLKMYLNGEFGKRPSDVNAYAASAFYAVDRYASWKKVWGGYYRDGGLVLSDRYTTSNAVHQASKLPETQWEDFFRWLFDFECDKLGLPRPNLVLYLDMPTEKAVENLRRRERDTRTAGIFTRWTKITWPCAIGRRARPRGFTAGRRCPAWGAAEACEA
jgi:dTMP kinase